MDLDGAYKVVNTRKEHRKKKTHIIKIVFHVENVVLAATSRCRNTSTYSKLWKNNILSLPPNMETNKKYHNILCVCACATFYSFDKSFPHIAEPNEIFKRNEENTIITNAISKIWSKRRANQKKIRQQRERKKKELCSPWYMRFLKTLEKLFPGKFMVHMQCIHTYNNGWRCLLKHICAM